VLIDRQIREALNSGELIVSPMDSIDSRIQPASLDVRLGAQFMTFDRRAAGVIDPKTDSTHCWTSHGVGEQILEEFVVHPGELVLATTHEYIELAPTLAARVEGKSSLGRLGIFVHSTAGFVDPGWPRAPITLEISTVVGVPVKLYPGMPIAQLAFERVEEGSAGYTGKYVGQSGPAASRYHRNWTGSAWI
jgi:dCTP deaminase